MQTLQIILLSCLITLCLTLIGVLIYFLFVLKDARETIEEANKILATARKLSSSVAFPLTTVMGIVGGLTKGLKAVRSISNMFEDEEEDEEYDED